MTKQLEKPQNQPGQAGAEIQTTEAELTEAIRAEFIDWARQAKLGALAELDGSFVAKSVLQRLTHRPSLEKATEPA